MMIIVDDVEQGTQAWIELRLGIPTASQFSRIVTPSGKSSSSRDAYQGELLAEWVLGEPYSDWGGNDATERGRVLEPDARRYYVFVREAEVKTVGFCYRDSERMVGCSPDGLVGDNGALELKVPSAGKHLFWLAQQKVPKEHFPQVQGAMWVMGRSWVDLMSYHPQLPPFIIRAVADPLYQMALDKYMPAFIGDLLAGRKRLKELGAVTEEEVA